jgi:hypothetical protein
VAAEIARAGERAMPSNKGMKQTSVERIGRSQLIPGVLRTGAGLTSNGRAFRWQ